MVTLAYPTFRCRTLLACRHSMKSIRKSACTAVSKTTYLEYSKRAKPYSDGVMTMICQILERCMVG